MKINLIFLLLLLVWLPATGNAQNIFRALIQDSANHSRLTGAIITDNKGHGDAANDTGLAQVAGLGSGNIVLTVSYAGYLSDTFTVTMPDNSLHVISMRADDQVLDEVVIVSSTRNNERIENAPTKVEVLGPEELGEENTIRPANIASILGDVSGVQIQQSSATSGNTNVRIQGLDGRYTQILRDGMPLYEGFSGGFGILQIPPLDLRQIELIKGSASTLYGGGAIAGLINLISKNPGMAQEALATLNVTTLKEQDVNLYLAKRNKIIGYTLFAGYTHQDAVDVNGDGFSDVPQLGTFTIHPRIFFYPDDKTTITAGYSGTFERRLGGDMQVIDGHTDSLHQYYEKDITQRHTAELTAQRSLPGNVQLTAKGTLSSFYRDVETNMDNIEGNQVNYYAELSAFIPQKKNNIVAGIDATGNNFIKLPGSDSIPLSSFHNNVLGAFAQYTLHLPGQTTVEAGLRADHTDEYGSFLLPRLTAIHHFSEAWAIRGGVGLGYKVPDPLDVQIIDYPLQYLQPLPASIKAERSAGYNLEGNFKKDLGKDINIFINHAFFLTQITSPVVATQLANNEVYFNNEGKPEITMGFDSYAKLTVKSTEVYFGYTYTDAERKYLAQDQFLPFTPRNRFAFTAVEEFTKKWRAGLEGSYIGTQYRDGDTNTPSYFLISLMVQYKINKIFTLVLNGENLLDYRQTRYEAIYTGPVNNPTFKTLWAPIDGRVINLSLRISPFGK